MSVKICFKLLFRGSPPADLRCVKGLQRARALRLARKGGCQGWLLARAVGAMSSPPGLDEYTPVLYTCGSDRPKSPRWIWPTLWMMKPRCRAIGESVFCLSNVFISLCIAGAFTVFVCYATFSDHFVWLQKVLARCQTSCLAWKVWKYVTWHYLESIITLATLE